MRLIVNFVFKFIVLFRKIANKVSKYFIKKYLLNKCGENVSIGRNFVATYSNLDVGSNSSLGENAYILNTLAKVIIKNNVMIAPNVTFVTGNHRTDIIGRYMNEIKDGEKLPCNDEHIIIEDDVWIGINTIILKGVTIGQGSIIGAGSIICENIEPFSIVIGKKAKKFKNRFSEEDLKKHKKLLGIR